MGARSLIAARWYGDDLERWTRETAEADARDDAERAVIVCEFPGYQARISFDEDARGVNPPAVGITKSNAFVRWLRRRARR